VVDLVGSNRRLRRWGRGRIGVVRVAGRARPQPISVRVVHRPLPSATRYERSGRARRASGPDRV